ncbi:hypothetical protein VTL71DRAFT_216 [Oculimacula yallundae]|uniref:Transmembrane protein n=1 Tax=Oculimacula yallundae TaxID=86028 RepID=A0ABR4CZC5_9HELO
MVAKCLSAFLILTLAAHTALAAYEADVCCNLAKERQEFIGEVPSINNQTCGQRYRPDLPAAHPLYVSYAFCSSECGGMGRSKLNQPSEWAAPIVQFLLPSVIFSISIPREKMIDIDYTQIVLSKLNLTNGWTQMFIFLLLFPLVLLPVLIDSVLWIIVVVVGAGNMIIGGLYEAVIDHRILKYVQSPNESDVFDKTELLATLASGNLLLSTDDLKAKTDPKTKILRSLQPSERNPDRSGARLLNLIGAQSSFGGAVGSPVLFYLGAFVYNIIDLHNDPSDEDNSISLGFGIEWMIVVHVAIISGTLLAANNPSTSSGIAGSDHAALRRRSTTGNRLPVREGWARWIGWSDSYDTEFQPVSIWSRGSNKMELIENTNAWSDEDFRNSMQFSFRDWTGIFILAFFLVVIPPASGGVVAWATPPIGVACRSLSFVLYGGSQLFTTILAVLQAASPRGHWLKRRWFLALSAPFWFFSLLAAIGGTVMQISGVYRNCICYAGSEHWVNIATKNPMVQLAKDTEAARHASRYWALCGSFATLFMALNCYIGWWYQVFIRRRFTDAVKNMFDADGSGGTELRVRSPTPVETQRSIGLLTTPHRGSSFEQEVTSLLGSSREMNADNSRGSDVSTRPSEDLEGTSRR